MNLRSPVTLTGIAEINASHAIKSRWREARHPENT